MSDTTTLTRRDVLRLLAAGVAGGSLLPQIAHADATPSLPRIDRMGLQQYTVRRALAKDIEGTIAAIAKTGITELEFFDMFDKDVAWWSALLRKYNLTAPSTHEGLPKTDEEWGPIFDRAHGMGHTLVVVPSVGNEYRGSKANWMKLAGRLDKGAAKARAAGLQFAYHNHDYEFAPVEGTTGYEILTTNTDAIAVKLEMDIYWTVKGGQDPLALMKRWPDRIVAVHVKDAGPAPERKMMDVGAGTIDFKTLLATGRKQGLQHWFIEHDTPADPIASITASAAALKKL
ncbi:MAG: sugar phosphate isomerase/epimerase [Gemmatimonadaceae bacterium]|nr:sugar phosphate isomerase/epimerase [Gemmatimonadaceae bacterium]